MGICKRLNAAGIPSPGEYRLAHGILMQRGKKSGAILWNRHVLTLILENRVYLGELVQRKQGKCLYAGIPSHVTREDERYCTRDAHTPLIGEALFMRVQQINALRSNVRRLVQASTIICPRPETFMERSWSARVVEGC